MSETDVFQRYAAAHLADVPAPERPPFGTREWWLQQPELAITILMLWRDRAPATFGGYLAEALTGTKPTGQRGKAAP